MTRLPQLRCRAHRRAGKPGRRAFSASSPATAMCAPSRRCCSRPIIFLDRSGEEIRRRTFAFTDPAGNELCLRPDLTIPDLPHVCGRGRPDPGAALLQRPGLPPSAGRARAADAILSGRCRASGPRRSRRRRNRNPDAGRRNRCSAAGLRRCDDEGRRSRPVLDLRRCAVDPAAMARPAQASLLARRLFRSPARAPVAAAKPPMRSACSPIWARWAMPMRARPSKG